MLGSQPPYEGFNYANGSSLTGQNGGVGWTGAWTMESGYSGDHASLLTGDALAGRDQ